MPNAPKRQPCPKCHGWARRVGKTLGLAQYQCKGCQVRFNVRLKGGMELRRV